MDRRLPVFFCPACWAEVAAALDICPRCGTDIEAVQEQRDFADKLLAALDHPIADTAARVAMILGQLREGRAVEALMRVVCQAKDAYVVEAAVEALGRIGEPRSRSVLEVAVCRGTVRVRLAARQALTSLRIPLENHDERD